MRCLVCRSHNVIEVERESKVKAFVGKKSLFHICLNCLFIHQPNNKHDFKSKRDYLAGSDPKKFLRVGDGKRKGREYAMAKMAIDMHEILKPRILIYGAGISRDHELLRKEGYPVDICDFVNVQNSPHWIDQREIDDKYDIIISSEVFEHFDDPMANLVHVTDLLHKDGLSIHGTNMNDCTPIEKVHYVWTPGHCSYWSGPAIREASEILGLYYDIRPTDVKTVSPRKRYIFLCHSETVRNKIPAWFAEHRCAWSEDTKL